MANCNMYVDGNELEDGSLFFESFNQVESGTQKMSVAGANVDDGAPCFGLVNCCEVPRAERLDRLDRNTVVKVTTCCGDGQTN